MALKLIDHGSKDYRQMIDLRYNILRKPLGLFFTDDELEKEKNDILIACFDEDKIEACCVLTPNGKEVRLRQMAVLPSVQGKGLGRAMMQFAENVASDFGYRKIIMHARKTAIGFYEKQGYSVAGDEFLEVTIPHYTMEKEL